MYTLGIWFSNNIIECINYASHHQTPLESPWIWRVCWRPRNWVWLRRRAGGRGTRSRSRGRRPWRWRWCEGSRRSRSRWRCRTCCKRAIAKWHTDALNVLTDLNATHWYSWMTTIGEAMSIPSLYSIAGFHTPQYSLFRMARLWIWLFDLTCYLTCYHSTYRPPPII